ncbi:hypothetical protein [Paenibacillus sp. FSL E2-0178]|uniref:hypothetical protein n=1 Tax=Paenibacillus sp. FSL E2-0178 TaxID=2921361 RepID=UPI003159003B
MSTSLIFGKGQIVEGVGLVKPITLNKYDFFQEKSSVLYYSKAHFGDEYETQFLLDLIVWGLNQNELVTDLIDLFKLTISDNITFFANSIDDYGFIIDEVNLIDKNNYDQIRSLIMRQNLMNEQKVYKDKLVQEWANKALEAKNRKGIKMTFEDMLSTVSVYAGKHYSDLEKYTIYQLQSDFNRIGKLIDYDATIAFKCAGDAKSKLNHYAEHVDLFRDPNDDLFVSQDKLKGLNQAMGN